HAAQHAVRPVLLGVHAPAGLGHALQPRDNALAAGAVAQRHGERVVGLALGDRPVVDIALLLEDARDLALHPGGGHRHRLVQRRVAVADTGEHVPDWITDHDRSSPARLRHSRDHALVGELAQADAAHPEFAEVRARAPAARAAVIRARLELRAPRLLDPE